MLPANISDLLEKKDWKSKVKALKLIGKSRLDVPEVVLQTGANLLKSYSWQLGQEYWEVCESVFYASLECQAGEWTKVISK